MITTSSVSSVGYYSGAGGGAGPGDESKPSAPSYYTGAVAKGEPPGTWSGRLAADLGLTGEVHGKMMEQVFEGGTAPDGSKIGRAHGKYPSAEDRIAAALAAEPNALPERQAEIRDETARSTRSACVGMDLTFSVPKSVTVIHTAAWRAEVEAERSGDVDRAAEFRSIRESIEGAIGTANRAAIDYAASIATSRSGTHGGSSAGTWVAAPDVITASFFQHTSRANDPQLHTHNVMANRARCADGEIRALDTVDLRQQRHAYSAVADRVLAEELGSMGIDMDTRPDGMSREVRGVDDAAMELFSARRRAITEQMVPAVERAEEKLGRPLNDLERNRLAQTINIVTRQSKDKNETDWDSMLDSWQERLIDELGSGLVPAAERVRADVEGGPIERDRTFSPAAIGAEAVQACADKRAAWSRADLMLEVERRLPLMALSPEDTVRLIDKVTDRTLAAHGVRQVAGGDGVLPPEDLVQGSYTRPSSRLYAAPVTLDAEDLIRRAAVERGRLGLDGKGVDAWLTANYPTIGQDQRAAVVGIASSTAALAQIVGPAGTGKSFAAGALAGVWSEQAGGKVHGLAVSQVAAEVLQGDGVVGSSNVSAWLASQNRLEAGRPMEHDLGRAVGPRDVVLVDEASMVGTSELDRVRDVVDSIGARMVLMGDPRQLGAVTAGGAMDLVKDRAETYTLTEVRRFVEEWEGKASLALRNGEPGALGEYDKHGRLVEAETMEEAITAAARAAAADRIAGRSVSVTTDTNEDAAAIANEVRAHLVAAGLVEPGGIHLPRSGSMAGVGDQIMTRQIDRELGVLNGSRFHVVDTTPEGGLRVVDEDGVVKDLPADYVTGHVHLAYASTVHAAQGKTVDTSYTVTDGDTDSSALYVGLTRGKERNTAFVGLQRLGADNAPNVEDGVARPTARSVLADALGREASERAARIEQEADAARLQNAGTILGRIEHATQLACRTRMETDLDRMVADGLLSEDVRARLASDQSSEHLSRVLRAAEQAGHDPEAVLREAAAGRALTDADSVAQVLSHRITKAHDVAAAAPGQVPAGRLPEAHAAYLDVLQGQAGDRARALGSEVAEQAPSWATRALGVVPDDAVERLEWETRAGRIAAYREAAKFDDPERAIDGAPGLTSTEKRAAWWGAWEALGQPEETRAEAALTVGQLQARHSAWEREQRWAPPHADDSLKAAELDAERSRQEAILAAANGDEEAAAEHQAAADRLAAVVRGMAEVAEGRAAWAAEVAVTRDTAERAARELRERGLTPGQEPDRVDAVEWLAEQRRAVEEEDEHRPITEADLPIGEPSVPRDEADAADSTPEVAEQEAPAGEGVDSIDAPAEEVTEPVRSPAHEVAPIEPDRAELEALVHLARGAEDRAADRASEEAAHAAWEAEQHQEPEPAAEAAYEPPAPVGDAILA